MALPVSVELRERIIAWRYELHLPIDAIITLSGRCERTVHYVLKTFRDYNQVNNPFTQPRSRKRILDHDDLNYIESILLAEPALFLDEIQNKLRTARDVEVSISTISRTLCHLTLTHKAVAKEAMERNEHLHATWQIAMAQYDPCQIVCIDEAGVDDHTNIHRCGWAPIGQACMRWTSFLRGKKYSILPALSLDGIVALDIFEGSVNRDRFIGFLRDHLVRLHIVKVVYFINLAILGPEPEPVSDGPECSGDG